MLTLLEPGQHLFEDSNVSLVSSDSEAIKAVLNAYRNSLVRSDAQGCAGLYAEDGATMAQTFPTQLGKEAVREWYSLCFSMISLDVQFEIKEVVVTSDEYAFARTTSAGTQTQLKSEKTSQEGNQELFVMKKVHGEWKIFRYCFCTTNSSE